MTDYIASGTDLTAVANAIRTKGSTSASLAFPSGFVTAINNISGGGIQGGYTVTFEVDDEDYAMVSCVAGDSILPPKSPTKSGYVYGGWATTEGASASNVSFPYTPTGDVTLYIVWQAVLQYKASPEGYGSSATSSVSFSTNTNMLNWTPEEVTQDGSVFIKFPTFYRKVVTTSNNQITSFIISSWKEDSEFEPYPCFVSEDGDILPYVLMGKYCSTSSSTADSTNGAAVTMTISAGRTLCANKGTGYQQMDWMIFKLWQDLLCAKMQTINTNSGSGITTDVLGVCWQQNSSYVYPWIDGVTYRGVDKTWVFSYKPSKYVDAASSSTSDYNLASYTFSGTTGQEIESLGYDSNNSFFNYPKTTTSNSSYNTYYCDVVYTGTSETHSVRSRVGDADEDRGAFYCSAGLSWTTTVGVRLCYRPLTA